MFIILFLFSLQVNAETNCYETTFIEANGKAQVVCSNSTRPVNAVRKMPRRNGRAIRNINIVSIQNFTVDDHSKPIYRDIADSSVNVDCIDEPDCIAKMPANPCPDDTELLEYASKASLGIVGTGFLLWCSKVTGFETKVVQRQIFDQAKSDTWTATINQERQDRIDKRTAIRNARQRLITNCPGATGINKDFCDLLL